jgi:hypothetical protein
MFCSEKSSALISYSIIITFFLSSQFIIHKCISYLCRFISFQQIKVPIQILCLVTTAWQYHHRMSRIPFCCCASMLSCPAVYMLFPALIVKNVGLIMCCDWLIFEKYDNTKIERNEWIWQRKKSQLLEEFVLNIGTLDIFIAMCISSRYVQRMLLKIHSILQYMLWLWCSDIFTGFATS